MAWYRCGGGGLSAGLQSDMDTVFNKKFSTSTTYPPTDWPDTVNLMGPLPEKTASGAIANITDGADGVPIKNWLVTLPASLDGYTAIHGKKAGKNLWEFGDKNVNATYIMLTLSTPLPAGTYTISAVISSTYTPCDILFRKEDGSAITSRGLSASSPDRSSGTVTLSEPAYRIYLYSSQVQAGHTATWKDIQIEVGSTATAYEAYTAPTQYTASLGRTIYGGSADIVTGEGSADGAVVTLDDTMSYGINLGTDTNRIAVSFYNSVGKINGTFDSNVLTVGENTSGGYKSEPWVIWGSTSAARMWISVPTSIDTVDKFKQYLQTNTITIAYELATPTAFTFTPITPTPETALGVNNFWADEGDSDVTYRADISLALQALGGGGRGLMMMRPTEPEETEETEETEGLEDELNR